MSLAFILPLKGVSFWGMSAQCCHFPLCGGCTSQDVPYEVQLRHKFLELTTLYGEHAPCLLEPLAAASHWGYRNKMEFSFSQNRAKEPFLGLFMKRGRVLDLTECPITPSWFVEALDAVREWWKGSEVEAYHPFKDRGALRTLILREGRRTGDRLAMLTVSGNSAYALKEEQIQTFAQALERVDGKMSIFLRIQQAIKGRPTQFFEHLLSGPDHITEALTVQGRETTFHISPSSFFQPNTEQAEVILNEALKLLKLSGSEILFDLYCGAGMFTIALAPHVRRAVGIELNPYAVFDARANAKANDVENAEFFQGDVGAVLGQLADTRADVAIVDPPRSGLGAEATTQLLRLLPHRVLYVSCNPKTQAQDLQSLKGHYRISALLPVDQFPHTPHIEVLALLERV